MKNGRRTIHCQKCQTEFETTRHNTKYCSVCRLKRDLDFINDFTVECWQCSEPMSPLERGDKTCGSCQYRPKKHGIAACGFCGNERPCIARDVAVCHVCGKDPALRGKLLHALRKKVEARSTAARIEAAA